MLLPDGRATVSRVEAVIFDAMYTVIESKLPRFFMISKIFEEALGKPFTPKDLSRYLRESKSVVDPSSDYVREWTQRNCWILARLRGVDVSQVASDEGYQIHQSIVSASYLYEVKPEMLHLLRLLVNLQNPPRLVLASNQYKEHLESLIKALELPSFDSNSIFTSDELSVSKPNPLFYERVLTALGLTADQVVIVGNSVTRDLPPAQALGIPICLYDRGRKLDWPSTSEVGVVHDHEEMRRWLLSWLLLRPDKQYTQEEIKAKIAALQLELKRAS